MQGYVGITNFMGARFTASDAALAPMLREVAKRGLIYVDDGSSPRSQAGQIAGANKLPFAKADVVIDAVPSAVEIDNALKRLESMARERGMAVGYRVRLARQHRPHRRNGRRPRRAAASCWCRSRAVAIKTAIELTPASLRSSCK